MQTEAERVRSYIKSLSLAQLMQPFNRDAMANPACLDWYIALAQKRLASAAS